MGGRCIAVKLVAMRCAVSPNLGVRIFQIVRKLLVEYMDIFDEDVFYQDQISMPKSNKTRCDRKTHTAIISQKAQKLDRH